MCALNQLSIAKINFTELWVGLTFIWNESGEKNTIIQAATVGKVFLEDKCSEKFAFWKVARKICCQIPWAYEVAGRQFSEHLFLHHQLTGPIDPSLNRLLWGAELIFSAPRASILLLYVIFK